MPGLVQSWMMSMEYYAGSVCIALLQHIKHWEPIRKEQFDLASVILIMIMKLTRRSMQFIKLRKVRVK